ncbi:hypothetical protein GCM10023142_12180 [Anaerocolumna aminovalerica]|jgi:hypothetical protein
MQGQYDLSIKNSRNMYPTYEFFYMQSLFNVGIASPDNDLNFEFLIMPDRICIKFLYLQIITLLILRNNYGKLTNNPFLRKKRPTTAKNVSDGESRNI